VEAAVEADEARAMGVKTRQFDRRLDGLRAGVAEERLRFSPNSTHFS